MTDQQDQPNCPLTTATSFLLLADLLAEKGWQLGGGRMMKASDAD